MSHQDLPRMASAVQGPDGSGVAPIPSGAVGEDLAIRNVAWARDLLLLIGLALVVRLATFNGAFGSDDLTYIERAFQLARGEWTSANYNGALRYGFNLPAAGFIALFGPTVFVANIWPLACSLIEVGAVFAFACAAMNRLAGISAGLLLASAPLHMAVASRIHADPIVSMFVTLGFVLVYFGVLRREPRLLFAAGMSIGGIFWTKELAAVTWFAFLPLLWFFRGQWKSCVYVVAGTLLMMALHGALMTALAGDPLHLIKVVLGALRRNFIDGGQGEDSATFYLRYLFLDVRHVGVIGFLAIASFWLLPRWLKAQGQPMSGFYFAMLWWLGLLAVLSLFPVSLSPLRLTMKQSNYITLFLGPMAVLAGMTIAALPRFFGRVALALGLLLGLLLGVLEQADYRVFTANSKALAVFAIEHPGAVIVGSTNNGRLANFWARQMRPGAAQALVIDFHDYREPSPATSKALNEAVAVFAVLDRQTMLWMAGGRPITAPLPCWSRERDLSALDLGVGNEVAAVASAALSSVKPTAILLEHLARPMPATVYRVVGPDVLCRGNA